MLLLTLLLYRVQGNMETWQRKGETELKGLVQSFTCFIVQKFLFVVIYGPINQLVAVDIKSNLLLRIKV